MTKIINTEDMATILHIGDSYITNLEELRDVFTERIPAANENTRNRLYNEIKTLFYDDVLLHWLEEGGDEDKQIAQRIVNIDKNDNESNIQKCIEEAVTYRTVAVVRPLGKYLELISKSFSINGKKPEPVPHDSEIHYPTDQQIRLDMSFKFKCVKFAMERFTFQLKTNGECVIPKPEKEIDVSKYIEGNEYDIQYAGIIIPTETKSLEFRLEVDYKDVCTIEFLGDDDLNFVITNEKGDTEVEFKMIKVWGGTFNTSSKYKVTLDDYYIGETVVTQKLWNAVMRGTEYEDLSKFKGDNRPVESVSWKMISEYNGFLYRLNKFFEKKLTQKMKFKLPTEAQWEFAARGGKQSEGYKYSGGDNIEDVAWYDGNSGEHTHPVKDGSKFANGLKIYDMSGNVWEWCQDIYVGKSLGDYRVIRGGSWNFDAECCSTAYRSFDSIDGANNNLGFRLVLSE